MPPVSVSRIPQLPGQLKHKLRRALRAVFSLLFRNVVLSESTVSLASRVFMR
jgi:hypothetical protein